ncbi:MAG: hypothetical protein AAFY31_17795, partial [Pseudomonadota bacterium]
MCLLRMEPDGIGVCTTFGDFITSAATGPNKASHNRTKRRRDTAETVIGTRRRRAVGQFPAGS